MDGSGRTRRQFKKAVWQGRSKRRGDAYFVPYWEPLSDARTPLADFFNSLPAVPEAVEKDREVRPTISAGTLPMILQ